MDPSIEYISLEEDYHLVCSLFLIAKKCASV